MESVFGRKDFRGFGGAGAGDGADFGADDVRREAGAEKARVERGDFALVERTADVREAAFQASTNQAGLVGLGEDCVDGSFDIPVGNPTRPELTCNAERP